MQKRGQFEIQFNWIFVLVAGALILLFFSVIMLKQKDISEQTTNQFISRNLKAIIASAEVSTGTLNFVDLPKVEIEFECNKYRIGSASRRFEIMSVFAPSKIKSNKMLTWTLAWNLPYRVTNFLYLTSPNIRYILIGDNDLAREINKTLPKELNKELVKPIPTEINTIKNKNDHKVRFVFFDTNIENSVISEFDEMSSDDLTALKVYDADEDKGTIEFYKKGSTGFMLKGKSHYLKKPSLIGAIFTDNIEMYDCTVNNAFKKLKIVTEVYEKKSEILRDYYDSQGDNCKNYHDLTSLYNEILTASNEFNDANIAIINTHVDTLEQKNKDAQLYSCALIY